MRRAAEEAPTHREAPQSEPQDLSSIGRHTELDSRSEGGPRDQPQPMQADSHAASQMRQVLEQPKTNVTWRTEVLSASGSLKKNYKKPGRGYKGSHVWTLTGIGDFIQKQQLKWLSRITFDVLETVGDTAQAFTLEIHTDNTQTSVLLLRTVFAVCFVL